MLVARVDIFGAACACSSTAMPHHQMQRVTEAPATRLIKPGPSASGHASLQASKILQASGLCLRAAPIDAGGNAEQAAPLLLPGGGLLAACRGCAGAQVLGKAKQAAPARFDGVPCSDTASHCVARAGPCRPSSLLPMCLTLCRQYHITCITSSKWPSILLSIPISKCFNVRGCQYQGQVCVQNTCHAFFMAVRVF